MLLSIIVPIYNMEAYLEKCIQSILAQNLLSMEIILVNDGSTDRSEQICRQMEKKDSRIRYIKKENGGLSSARNAGLSVSRGDFLLFVDSDDYLEPGCLDAVLPAISGFDAVIFNYVKESTDGKPLYHSHFQSGDFSFSSPSDLYSYLLTFFFRYTHGWEVWNRLYRGDIIRKNKLFFYDNRKIYAEDIEFNLRYLYYCKKIRVIPDCLYHYISRSASLSRIARRTNTLPRFNCLSREIYRFFLAQGDRFWIRRFPLLHYSILRIGLHQMKEHRPKDLRKATREISDLRFYRKYLLLFVLHPARCMQFLSEKDYLLGVSALLSTFALYNLSRTSYHKLFHHFHKE